MKRVFLVYPLVCSVLLVALFANVAGAGNILAAINGVINGNQEVVIESPELMCWVSDTPGGTPVQRVRESTYTTEHMYWLTYVPGRTIYSLSFMVFFVGGGASPLVLHWQVFSWPAGYSGGTTTPFGVPWWGGDPIIGPALLVPMVDGVMEWANYYLFDVVK